MASGWHTFMTGTVFSPVRYEGNRLAIVSVRGNALTEERKSMIAREFGYSETVFLHDAPGPGQPRRCDIFTEHGEELPFAGHPIIGVTHFLFMFIERIDYRPTERDSQRQSAVLMTKAGAIPISFNPYRQVAACAVPYDIHVHKSRIAFGDVLVVQPQVKIVPTIEKVNGKSSPIVSVVKGMTFCLVDLTEAPEVLTALRAGEAPAMTLDEEWNSGFRGAIYYERRGEDKGSEPTIYNMHVRMITQGIEDPGTGSGNCALACYLALASGATSPKQAKSATGGDDLASKTEKIKLGDKTEHHVFAIEQGLEMGRKCTMAIEVDIEESADGKREVSRLILSGRATFFTRGEIMGVY